MPQVTGVNLRSPVQLISAAGIIKTLVSKGKTLDTLREKPKVQFKKDELAKLSCFQKPENPLTNQFVNEVIRLALEGNKFFRVLFRRAQLDTVGLKGKIRGNQPAVIDLDLLGMHYQGSGNIEAKAIRYTYSKDPVAKPEDLKKGTSDMPLSLRWGVTRDKDDTLYCVYGASRYVPNEDYTKWLISSPVIFTDTPPPEKTEESEKSIEVNGLVFRGLDGGKKLEISPKESFTGTKDVTLPFFIKEDEEVRFVKLHIEDARN